MTQHFKQRARERLNLSEAEARRLRDEVIAVLTTPAHRQVYAELIRVEASVFVERWRVRAAGVVSVVVWDSLAELPVSIWPEDYWSEANGEAATPPSRQTSPKRAAPEGPIARHRLTDAMKRALLEATDGGGFHSLALRSGAPATIAGLKRRGLIAVGRDGSFVLTDWGVEARAALLAQEAAEAAAERRAPLSRSAA